VVDYGFVEQHILDLAARYRVEAVAIDPHNSVSTQTRLLDEGLPVLQFRQGALSMSPGCKELERRVLARQLYHAGCPVLRWNLSNVALEQDSNANIKITKSKSREKVDGAVALVMAIGVAQAADGPSIYESRPEFLTI
jgi:phage terminase large subunit-like protein